MKNFIVFCITVTCFALYSVAHYSFLLYINPHMMPWQQFETNGTLVYSNSGFRLFTVSILKSFAFSIPFSLLFMIRLNFKFKKLSSAIRASIILNALVFLTVLLFSVIAISFSNIYFEHFASFPNTIANRYPGYLADTVHLSLISGLTISFIALSLYPDKVLNRVFKFI